MRNAILVSALPLAMPLAGDQFRPTDSILYLTTLNIAYPGRCHFFRMVRRRLPSTGAPTSNPQNAILVL